MYSNRFVQTAVHTTARTAINSAVYGTDFADSLRENLKTAAIDEVAAMGAGEIGDKFASGSMAGGPGSVDYWLHKGSHAALGCATASAKGGDCASGAVGGVAAEIVAEQYAKSAFQSGIHSENGLDVDAFNSQVKLVGKYAALAGAALTGKDAQTAVDAGANAVDNNLCGTGLCIAAGFAIVKGVALGVAWVGTELAHETAKAVAGEENVISDAKLSEAQKAVGEEALLQAGGMFIGEGLVSIGGRILTKTQALRKLAPKEVLTGVNESNSFFSGTKYTNKVLGQMRKGDFHAFPESVTVFEKNGIISTIKGKDGITRQMLKIPGQYKDKNGFFEFIKEADGSINHRFFRPKIEK